MCCIKEIVFYCHSSKSFLFFVGEGVAPARFFLNGCRCDKASHSPKLITLCVFYDLRFSTQPFARILLIFLVCSRFLSFWRETFCLITLQRYYIYFFPPNIFLSFFVKIEKIFYQKHN